MNASGIVLLVGALPCLLPVVPQEAETSGREALGLGLSHDCMEWWDYTPEQEAQLVKRHGYEFTLSPDGVWMALVVAYRLPEPVQDSYSAYRLHVVHLSSGQVWAYEFETVDFAELESWEDLAQHAWRPKNSDWTPACFSRDGRLLLLNMSVAELSPTMASLELRDARPSRVKGDSTPQIWEAPTGAGLGIPSPIKNRVGEVVDSLWSLTQEEGEWGNVAWSPDGEILYERARAEGDLHEHLVIEPSGVARGVDYGFVHRAHRALGFSAEASKRRLREQWEAAGVDPSEIELILQNMTFDFLDRPIEEIGFRMRQLAVSPDGKSLAAVVQLLPTGNMAGSGFEYGVVIPLDRGGLAAFPFAEHVNSKMIWSPDSRSLYFRGTPLDQLEAEIDIHRIDLALADLPAFLPEFEPGQ